MFNQHDPMITAALRLLPQQPSSLSSGQNIFHFIKKTFQSEAEKSLEFRGDKTLRLVFDMEMHIMWGSKLTKYISNIYRSDHVKFAQNG